MWMLDKECGCLFDARKSHLLVAGYGRSSEKKNLKKKRKHCRPFPCCTVICPHACDADDADGRLTHHANLTLRAGFLEL